VDECVRLAEEIAAALGEAHSHDIQHRDLKPDNIVLTAKGSNEDLPEDWLSVPSRVAAIVRPEQVTQVSRVIESKHRVMRAFETISKLSSGSSASANPRDKGLGKQRSAFVEPWEHFTMHPFHQHRRK
jgi:serine/threonine protein kinase